MTSLLTNARCFLKPHDICFLGEDLHFCRDNQTKRQSGEVAEWLKAADCKSARVAYVGSNPTLTTMLSSCFHKETGASFCFASQAKTSRV